MTSQNPWLQCICTFLHQPDHTFQLSADQLWRVLRMPNSIQTLQDVFGKSATIQGPHFTPYVHYSPFITYHILKVHADCEGAWKGQLECKWCHNSLVWDMSVDPCTQKTLEIYFLFLYDQWQSSSNVRYGTFPLLPVIEHLPFLSSKPLPLVKYMMVFYWISCTSGIHISTKLRYMLYDISSFWTSWKHHNYENYSCEHETTEW